MSWLEAAIPVRMRRVALVAPAAALPDVLLRVAQTGTVEIGPPDGPEDVGLESARAQAPAGLVGQDGAFEAQLAGYAGAAVQRSGAAALAGWVPASKLKDVVGALAEAGGTVVTLPNPPGVQPPTQVGGPPLRRSVAPLVQTYGTVPYADIDPVWLAWAGYVLMFGMMFGDVGEGALLVAVAVALRAGWPRWARRFRQAWPFVGGAGLTATVFGLLYGDCFGPNGLVPTVWLDPLDQPDTLLIVATGTGAVLLAGAYGLGMVNRWREGGWPSMLYAPSGVAGTGLFLGAGMAAGGWYFHDRVLLVAGGVVALLGLALAAVGFIAEAGGVIEVAFELFDLVVRLLSNVISFTRLAAFGLTHAALGLVVWEGAQALWRHGGPYAVGAVAVFAVGTAVAFSLEALVAAIQALRLEYYELFSRVFTGRGRPFRPWRVPATGEEGAAEDPAMKEAA
jgi:V/A-type H+/Na+-transporting ATPase subunit I